MKKIIRNMFGSTLSYWFYLVTITAVMGSFLWPGSVNEGVLILSCAIFAGLVEGIAMYLMDDL